MSRPHTEYRTLIVGRMTNLVAGSVEYPVQHHEFGFRITICNIGDLVLMSLTIVLNDNSSSALSSNWLVNILSRLYFLLGGETTVLSMIASEMKLSFKKTGKKKSLEKQR